MFIFPAQLTASGIGNLTRLIHTLLYVMTIHTYIHTYMHTYIPYTVYNIKTRDQKKTETGHVDDRTPLFKSTDHSIFMQLLLPPQNLRRRHQLSASCTTPLRLRCNALCCIVLNRNVLYCIVLPGTLYCTVPCCSKNQKSKHMLPSQGFGWRFQTLCLFSPFSPDRYPSCSRELPAPPTARSRSPSRGPGRKVRCWTASGRCQSRSIVTLPASSSRSHRRMTWRGKGRAASADRCRRGRNERQTTVQTKGSVLALTIRLAACRVRCPGAVKGRTGSRQPVDW